MDSISSKYWMTYILIILVVVLLWIAVFRFFHVSNDKHETKRKLIGISIFGPLWLGVHSYMQDHGWRLTHREIIGWILVIILMILAPVITHFIGR